MSISLTEKQRDAVVARRSEISEATRALIEKGIGDGSIEPSNSKLATLFILGAVNWIPLWYRELWPSHSG